MKKGVPYDISSWVAEIEVADDREFREAVHTILTTITGDDLLRSQMILKGGILLALRYRSSRFTKDIDFSTKGDLSEITPEKVKQHLMAALPIAVASLEYDVDCRVQSCKLKPRVDKNPTFPSIKLTIGYARRGTRKHRKLLQNNSTSVVEIDFSLNETIVATQELEVESGQAIIAYSFEFIVAEKMRALLQQESRNRYRRQDIYDLNLLLTPVPTIESKKAILDIFLQTSASRNITASVESLDDSELKRRAQEDCARLQDEIEGELPEFEEAFAAVQQFYRFLPWD